MQLGVMSTLAVMSTKGGAGKSTAAAMVGIAAAGLGRKVRIIDCDTAQTSINVWARALRKGRPPEIMVGTYETIAPLLAEAERDGCDLVIVDVPPGGGQLVNRIASLVEHILIPVRVTTFDLHALRNTVDMLSTTVDASQPEQLQGRNALAKAAIVLNGVSPRAPKALFDDVNGALAACGAGDLEIIGTLCERAGYATSIAKGLGVTEDGRDAAAAEEVVALYERFRLRERRRASAVRKLAESGRGSDKRRGSR